ncbi:MAG TPA: ATPase, T2SS/T4P/T4SS family [Candidatus Dormibacteraeota bacterium]|nr:ATPase, T2SS/T4P/T4SS family [Candidatus Dormibacteraeota bacterium]
MAAIGQKKRGLTSILIDGGIVTPEQVDLALVRQVETGRLIGESLVELGFTTEENIAWALSKQLGIPYADVHADTLDSELVNHFGEALLRRVQAVPLFRSHDEIVIATVDPTDTEPVAELRGAAGTRTTLVIGCPSAIRRALDSVYGLERIEEEAQKPTGIGRFDVVWDRAGTSFLLYHLHTARGRRASEIHFIPSPEGLSIHYRTDRGLEPQGVERPETAAYLRQRLAHLGAPDLAEGSVGSAWGSVVVDVGGTKIHAAVFHCRADSGVTTVLRLTPIPAAAPDLSALGISPIGEAEIRDFVEGPEGLVIVHGPPRSGGSTVLAALAALAARPERRTLVLEPASSAPYGPGTTRVRVAAAGGAETDWERIAVGLGADVVVLDDVLRGREIEGVLSGATVGRLVFARTDWLDGRMLLAELARSRHGRAVLRDRPFAMISLPSARREGSGVWSTPAVSEADAGLLEATILTEEDRDALLVSASAPTMRSGGGR